MMDQRSLCAEPEVQTYTLTSEDEFLVLACDGLWDVMSSQRCMELARSHLRDNNDPQLCAEYLVSEFSKALYVTILHCYGATAGCHHYCILHLFHWQTHS